MRNFNYLFFLLCITVNAQPNCNVYLWKGDTLQYEACILSEKLDDYYQFDMKAIGIMDSCISICPYFAYAYYEKAVVYLKAGNFIKWDEYINKAVELEPSEYLSSRASCRGKFFADYEGAISDIEALDALVDYDIGYIHNGDYHLNAYKALCYKSLGKYRHAIEIFETHFQNNPDDIGFYDYLHIAVCYQALNQHEEAIQYFKLQEQINNLAENQYYVALSYKALGDMQNFENHLLKAEKMLLDNQKMVDGYHVMEDEIFLSDIEEAVVSSLVNFILKRCKAF